MIEHVVKDKLLSEYIDDVLTGGKHLATCIGEDHPSHHTTQEEALKHYGSGRDYDVWFCWKTIMSLKDFTEAGSHKESKVV